MRAQIQKSQVRTKLKPISSRRFFTFKYLHPVLQLQHQFGNQALQRLLQSRHIQAKLTVDQPNEEYE